MRNRRSAGLGRLLPPHLGRLRRGSGVQGTQAGGTVAFGNRARINRSVASSRRPVWWAAGPKYARRGARTPLSTYLGLKLSFLQTDS